MSDTLYDADFFAWTQEQAALLRGLPRSNALDIEHLAEEIEDMGREQLHKAESLLRQIFIHLIKAAAEPDGQAVEHWMGEIATFHFDLVRVFAPSMRQRIDLDGIWVAAMKAGRRSVKSIDLPEACPWQLDVFLDADFEPEAAVDVLRIKLARPS